MKTWTEKEKNRILSPDDKGELERLHEHAMNCSWRETFHVVPMTGHLNDPNGFCYRGGKWHLYYQWFPYGAASGLKHWYHTESEDLVHWQNKGLHIKPDLLYDNYGCFSGSSYIENGTLYFCYTGNNMDVFGTRHPYQLLAWQKPDGTVEKLGHALISQPEGYTEHVRDPKLFKHDGTYYILLGARDLEKHGKFLLYSSSDIKEGWQKAGELKVKGYDFFGSMVECPDLEKIGDKWVLIFSLVDSSSDARKYSNLYFIGDMDFEKLEFIPDGDVKELDSGFDFYAAQCAYQNKYDDTAVLSGWIGCPGYTYPLTAEDDWEGVLSLPRELRVEDGKLKQKPARTLTQVRGKKLFEAKEGSIVSDTMHGLMPRTAILRLDDPQNESIQLNLFARSQKNGFAISYDKFRRRLTVDRGDLMEVPNKDAGTNRSVVLADGLSSLEIYIDKCTIEVFVNDGEYVFSAMIFAQPEENLIRMGGKDIDLVIYETVKTVEDDFAL